jgi:hypothetical protein
MTGQPGRRALFSFQYEHASVSKIHPHKKAEAPIRTPAP